MANADFLYSVGVDFTQAQRDLQKFVDEGQRLLAKLGKVQIDIGLDRAVNGVSKVNGEITKTISLSQRKAALEDQWLKSYVTGNQQAMNAANRGLTAIQQQEERLYRLRLQQQRLQLEQAALAERQARALSSGGSGGSGGAGMTANIGRQSDAFDRLGRIMNNMVFKFVEYEILMQGVNSVIHEFTNSLSMAGNVQLEQTLQRLYAPTIDYAAALRDSIKVAKQWGADILDVQQVIGLWTKKTGDLTAATYLADQAEQMHRASGIETLDVYKDSIAILEQLGVQLKELPVIYNEVAAASLRIAVPMRDINGKGGMSAMKDLFQGLAESAATLKAMGFDKEGIIAVVANQVEAMGEHGKEAAKNLTSMFAALEGRGKYRSAFEAIVGKPEDIKNTDDLLQRMQAHVKELYQAYANGDLGVRPQQYETLQTFAASLKRIAELRKEIFAQREGKLEFVAQAEIDTYTGQVDRLRASFQQFTLTVGTQLLPTATSFVQVLRKDIMPMLIALTPAMLAGAGAAIKLGVAFLALTAINRVSNAILAVGQAEAVATIAAENFGRAQLGTVGGMADAIAQMEAEKAALAEYAQAAELAAWQTTGLGKALNEANLSMAQLTTIMETRTVTGLRAAGLAFKEFALSVAASAAPLLAIYGIMELVSGFAASRNRVGNFNVGLDMAFDKNYAGQFGTGLQNFGRVAVLGLTGQKGQLGQAGDIIYDITQGRARKGEEDLFKQARIALMQARPGMAPDEETRLYQESRAKSLIRDIWLKRNPSLTQDDEYNRKKLENDFKNSSAAAMRLAAGAGSPVSAQLPDKSLASPYDILNHRVQEEKNAYQGVMSKYNDNASAAANEIKAIQELAKVHGWNAQSVQELQKTYAQEIYDKGKAAEAAAGEMDAMKRLKVQADAFVSSTKDGTKEHEKAIADQSKAQVAYDKSSGAVAKYRGEITKLLADMQAATRDASFSESLSKVLYGSDLSSIGGVKTVGTPFGQLKLPGGGATTLSMLQENLKSINESYTKAIGLNAQLNAAVGAKSSIEELGTRALSVFKTDSGTWDQKQRDEFLKFISELSSAFHSADRAGEEKAKEIKDVTKSVRDLIDTAGIRNVKDLGELLGLDKGQYEYAVQLMQGYKEVSDEQDRLTALRDRLSKVEGGLTEEQRKQLDIAQQQVNQQKQLVPLLAQEREMRAQIEYQATNSVLYSHGSQAMNAGIDKIFGKGGLGSVFADWTKQVVDNWWKTAAQNITDTIFGSKAKKKEDDLLKMYTDHVDGTTKAANIMLEASQNQLKAAGQQKAGSGDSVATDDSGNVLVNSDGTVSTSGITALTASVVGGALTSIVPGFTGNLNDARIAGGSGGSGFNLGGIMKQLGFQKADSLGGQLAGGMAALSGFNQGGVGGALQAGLGTFQATGNPYIAAAAAAISLFHHVDNPALMPDKYDTSTWGQFLANFGAYNPSGTNTTNQIANGQHFDISSDISKETNSQGIGAYLHNIVNGMSDQEGLKVFGSNNWPQIKAMFSQWTSQGLHDGKNGNLMIGNTSYNWQQISQLGTAAMQALQTAGMLPGSSAGSNAPIFSIQAFGAGPSYSPWGYNTPGLTSSELDAAKANKMSGLGVAAYYQTPGVGTTNIGNRGMLPGQRATSADPSQQTVNITTNLVVDGQTLASIVNSYNNQTLMRYNLPSTFAA